MKNLQIPLTVLWLSTLALFTATASAQITPLADAYTSTANPTTKYGSATTLNVDGTTDTAYIQFNLGSIPSGATVSQATLKLYVNTVTTAGSFNVDYVTSAWEEGMIDGSAEPTINTGTPIASDVAITTADKNQYILVNVTSAVQAWLSGSEANNGIALVANSTFNATFDSKENTGTSHPPELDIVFAGGGISGITTASGSGLTGGGTSGTLNLSLINTCASGQVLEWNGSAWACATAKGTGTITGVTAGTDLTGGGTSGTVTLNLNMTALNGAYAQLGAANTFTAGQTVNGTVSATSFNIGSMAFAFGNSTSGNAFLGFSGNSTMTGSGNTGTGAAALLKNTSGAFNTAIGNTSLMGNTTGTYNTSLGYFSGQALNSGTLGNNNTFIGAGAAGATVSGLTNATAIGSNAEVAESNALVLGAVTGTNSGTSVNVGIGTTTPQYTLDVHGTGSVTGQVVLGSPTSASGWLTVQPTMYNDGIDVAGYSAATNSGKDGTSGIRAAGGNADPTSTANGGTGMLAYGGGAPTGNAGQGGPGVNAYGGSGNGYIDGIGGSFYGGSSSGGIEGDGIEATAGSGYAGYFLGNVAITGSIIKSGGSFKIDHPLDPANKYLYHSFVESPDMMNIYNGNATLDANGEAVITMPDWFSVLNRDFRYQLTCIGGFAPVYIAEELANNQFKIGGGRAGVKVSWQITGIRQDAWANAHRIPVEEEKDARLKGYYIHPELYGAPAEKQIEWARHPLMMAVQQHKQQIKQKQAQTAAKP